jgi:hypothetical protein
VSLTEEILVAAGRKASGGMRVAKPGGGEFDHLEKVEQALEGFNSQLKHLERLVKRSGLSEDQVGRINGLIERARSVLAQ